LLHFLGMVIHLQPQMIPLLIQKMSCVWGMCDKNNRF
jgi:hypothetical protein